MIYMETHSTDPYYNLAFEEYQLTHQLSGDLLILWQNENTIVVGLNQNTAEEVNSEFVRAHNIRVVRRSTGGGAVYHDLGNLNYSFITDVENCGEISINHFSETICSALRSMGISAEFSGRNDILVDGKKVSGTAQRLYGNRILHHGCLLFCSNPDMIANALNPNPLKYSSKSTKSVRSRIGNIADNLPASVTLEEFWRQFLSLLCDSEITQYKPSAAEVNEIIELANNKYRTREWNYGNSPEYTVYRREKFPGGILEFRANVENGRILSCAFYGDYLAKLDAGPLIEALSGAWFTPEDIAAVLSRFKLADYFGAITDRELLSLLCPSYTQAQH